MREVNATIRDGQNGYHERKVLSYLQKWYPGVKDETIKTNMGTHSFTIDWENVEIIVSGRMSRSLGRARNVNGKGQELKISKSIIENRNWARVQQVIRHEAIHIWQYQTDGFDGGHDWDFLKWADKFDCTVHAEKPAKEPKWLIECSNGCGVVAKRMRDCKLTKQTSQYHCSSCKSSLRAVRNR